jgi:hypothetical protein
MTYIGHIQFFEFNTCHVDCRQLNDGSMDLQI